VRHAFTTLLNRSKAAYRMNAIVGLLAVMIAIPACGVRDIHAPYEPSDEEIFRLVIRTPLRSVNLPEAWKKVPVALLEVSLFPQKVPEGKEIRLLSFPDEVIYDRGDTWGVKSNAALVPIADVLLLGLRQAGMAVEPYPTLQAAKVSGAQFAIVGALVSTEAVVKKQDAFSLKRNAQATISAELSVAIVDLESATVLWAGTLHEEVQHDNAIKLPQGIATLETDSLTYVGERRMQRVRTLIAQCYYHISMALASRLADTLSSKLR
jgi:hypothetical protein